MADWFLDHGCTLYPTAYMAAPGTAAGLPQDGDGKASGTGAAPASASASMDFTGVTAAAGATFQVMGATLTGVASAAGTTQFNVGSGAALAANLAAAINAATASPSVTTGGLASPYLKGLVWAVAAGAVLTVHSRIASADLNQASNASCILACATLGNWTSPPANANFSGGVSGPWAYLLNTTALASAINASVSAVCTYGAWVGTMMGSPVAGDVINIRTSRAGSDIDMALPASTAVTVNTRQVGSAASPLRYKFDDGAIWPAGGIFNITKVTGSVSDTILFRGYSVYEGKTLTGARAVDGGQPNFRFRATGSESLQYALTLNAPSYSGTHGTVFDTVDFVDAGNGSTGGSLLAIGQGSFVPDLFRPVLFKNCRLGNVARAGASMFNHGGSYGLNIEAVDCLLAFGSAVSFTKALLSYASAGATHNIRLIRPKFTGGGGGAHTLVQFGAAIYYSLLLYIEDPVDIGQFISSHPAASACGTVAPQTSAFQGVTDGGPGQVIVSSRGNRDMLIDMPSYMLEWRSAGFPTTGLSVLDNGVPFSLRFNVVPTSIGAGLVTRDAPRRAIRQTVVNTLGDAASLALTQRLLIDSNYGGSSYTPTENEWWVEGTYISSVDGSLKAFSTQGVAGSITADATAWSSLSYTPFAGASRNYSRWKINTTLANVEADSEVTLRVVCGRQPAAINEWSFIDPQFTLAV